MNNKNVCRMFVKGANEGKGSNLTIIDNKLYSYSTCICERVVNKRGYYNFIYNETKYSVSTSRHQYYLRDALSGENVIKVSGVEMYASSLQSYVGKDK